MAFEKTLTAASAEQFSVVDGGFLLTEENLTAIEATLSGHAAELQAANDATTAEKQNVETANQTIAAHEATISDLQAKVAKLEKQSPAFSETVRETTDKIGGNNSGKVRTSVDEEADRLRAIRDGK